MSVGFATVCEGQEESDKSDLISLLQSKTEGIEVLVCKTDGIEGIKQGIKV